MVYIHQWLKSLRVSQGVRARQFWTQTSSRSQGNVAEAQNTHRLSGTSDRSVPEQLGTNWVYVVKADSEPGPDMSSHSQNTPPLGRPDIDSLAAANDSSDIAPGRRLSDPDNSSPPLPNPIRIAPLKSSGYLTISGSI